MDSVRFPEPSIEKYPYLYKNMPADIGAKILTKGLSFSCVNNFVDKDNEFSFRQKPVSLDYFRWNMPVELMRDPTPEDKELALSLMKNPSLARCYAAYINSASGRVSDIQDMLKKHYYVCSLTTDSRTDYVWSDAEKSARLQLKLNTQGLLEEFPSWVRHVAYEKTVPFTNIVEFSKTLLGILYTKLEQFSNEKEVRIVFYDEQLKIHERINIGFQNETLSNGKIFYYNRRLPKYLEEIYIGKNCSLEIRHDIMRVISGEGDVEPQIKICEDIIRIYNDVNVPDFIFGNIFVNKRHQKEAISERDLILKRLRLLIDELSLYHSYDDVNVVMDILKKERKISNDALQIIRKSRYEHVKIVQEE